MQFCRTVTTRAQRKAGLGAAKALLKGSFTLMAESSPVLYMAFKHYSSQTMTCSQSESSVFTEALFIQRHLKWILFSIIIRDLRNHHFLNSLMKTMT